MPHVLFLGILCMTFIKSPAFNPWLPRAQSWALDPIISILALLETSSYPLMTVPKFITRAGTFPLTIQSLSRPQTFHGWASLSHSRQKSQLPVLSADLFLPEVVLTNQRQTVLIQATTCVTLDLSRLAVSLSQTQPELNFQPSTDALSPATIASVQVASCLAYPFCNLYPHGFSSLVS